MSQNRRCLSFGHSPGAVRYFGPGLGFFVRHCKRCFYCEAGAVSIDNVRKTISLEVQWKREMEKKKRSSDTISFDSLDTLRTAQDNVVNGNSQPQIVESEHLSDPGT
jgi:hypothetical protein